MFAQNGINLEISQLVVNKLITNTDSIFVEEISEDGPELRIECVLNNLTNDSIELDVSSHNFFISYLFNREEHSIISVSLIPDVSREEGSYYIQPHGTVQMILFITPLANTPYSKSEDQLHVIMRILPTLRVEYQDRLHHLVSTRILDVKLL
ncbi:hypothetical protein GCM10011318_11790 [Phaeocystidibacter marisrubri]|nr:hypothetical protein GCM10011318_11790 [Phaeocystidibacter marisrubri]